MHDSIFSIDSNDEERCTGFAGKCWWNANNNAGEHLLYVLPDHATGQTATLEYMSQGRVTEQEFKTLKRKSRVFRLTAIRKHGEVWGVLVLDSTDTDIVPEDGSPELDEQIRSLREAAERITLLIE